MTLSNPDEKVNFSSRMSSGKATMQRTLCKSKLHGATVTEANLHYAGSITIDAELMRAVDLVPYEQVHVLDITNGARVVTYCIEGRAGSGMVCANGAAAHLINKGDQVIILAYAQYSDDEVQHFKPKVLILDRHNRIAQRLPETSDAEAPQGASLTI
jgi:aspartate 1-decarboxylase